MAGSFCQAKLFRSRAAGASAVKMMGAAAVPRAELRHGAPQVLAHGFVGLLAGPAAWLWFRLGL